MKIPTLKNNAKYFERTIKLDGGINTLMSPMSLCENEMSDSINLIYKDSLLSCRKGFYTDADKILGVVDSSCKLKSPFKFLDGVFVIDGKKCRLGYMIVWDEKTFSFFYTYAVFEDGTHKTLNHIRFGASNGKFHIPETVCVFEGKSKKGNGIYLFCRTKDYGSSATDDEYGIYELNYNENYWESLSDSQFYIPTVYYHGRGNRFSESQAKGNSSFEKPSELEPQNLLTGYFYSCFSTDGCSDSFQLPITNISDKTVTCILTCKDGTVFRWVITDSQAEITFSGLKVKATLNRKTGLISFTQNSVPFALPIIDVNNLKILAYKNVPNGISSVVGTTNAINYKSKILLYGNHITPNKIFVASSENPLYFPKDCSCDVGVADKRIVAVKNLEDCLVALTEDSAYSLKLNEGDLIARVELISGENKNFFEVDKLSCSLLNFEGGCSLEKSIVAMGDKLVFKGRFGICVMSKTGKIYSISQHLPQAENNRKDNAVAFIYDGFYGINIDDKIYLANIQNVSIKNNTAKTDWYVWQLPENIILQSVFCDSKKPIFVFFNKTDSIYYLSVLSGDQDILFSRLDGEFITHTESITGFFKTSFIDFYKIKIEAVSLEVGAKKGILVEVDSGSSKREFNVELNLDESEYESGIIKKSTVYPSLKADKASIKVIGEAPFYINKLKFFYR